MGSEEWNVKNIFHIFATLDREVFNRTEFLIIDGRIFGEADTANYIVKIVEDTLQSSGRQSVLWPITSCDLVQVCHPCINNRGMNISVHCCSYITYDLVCTTFWIDLGSGGGSGGGGQGGGGSPGGGWDPPPCGEGEGRYLYVNPCGGGWIPVEDEPPVNPEPIDSILTKAAKFANKFSDSLMTLTLGYDSEYFFLIVNKGIDTQAWHFSGGTDLEVMQNYNVHSGFARIAAWHSHPDNADNSPGSGPSGGDLDQMWQARYFQNFVIFTECSNKRFAMVIENPQKVDNWFRTCGISRFALQDTMQARILRDPNYSTNFQEVSISKLLELIGNSSSSGIALYHSTNALKTTFAKLN